MNVVGATRRLQKLKRMCDGREMFLKAGRCSGEVGDNSEIANVLMISERLMLKVSCVCKEYSEGLKKSLY